MRVILKSLGASALLMSSTTALAYVPVGNNVPADADISLAWGGATASSLTAQEGAVSAVCASDAHLVYVTGGAFNDTNDGQGNDWVVFCITNNTVVPGLPAGNHRVMVVKRDRDGSGVGVGPVQVVDPVTTLNVPTGGSAGPPLVPPPGCVVNTPGLENAPIIPAPGGGNVPLIECPATYDVQRNMEMGTSDIEPDKFIGINTPSVDGTQRPFLPGAANGFDTIFETVPGQNALAALVFNTPVTLELRNRLQTVQFEAGSAEFDRCNPAGASYNVNVPLPPGDAVRPHTWAEDEACMPSLTVAEIASIMTGRIGNWNQLRIDNGNATAANITGAIQICRRVPGSGSQATLNALWMRWPCDPDQADGSVNVVQPRAPSAACAAPFTPGAVYSCSGSGDVDTCLHTLNGTANPLAIGILSAEGRNVQNNRNWRYIKTDGEAPTLRNVHAADYLYYAEQSCQFKRRTLPAGFNQVGGVNTLDNKRRLFNRICAPGTGTLASIASFNRINLGTAAPSTNPNSGIVYTWGQSGWLLTPAGTLTPNNVLNVQWPIDTDRPVNLVTRLAAAGTNICGQSLKTSLGAAEGGSSGLPVEPTPEWDPAGNDKLPELPDPYPNTEDDEDNGPDNAP